MVDSVNDDIMNERRRILFIKISWGVYGLMLLLSIIFLRTLSRKTDLSRLDYLIGIIAFVFVLLSILVAWLLKRSK